MVRDELAPSNTADGYSLDITVVDNDQCAVGGDMTIGDSRADHFHTVGLDDMTNENVTAATVRICLQTDTDRLLIDGITPAQPSTSRLILVAQSPITRPRIPGSQPSSLPIKVY